MKNFSVVSSGMDFGTMCDASLVEHAKKGVSGAFASLFSRHYSAMYRLSLSVCRHDSDAEDITQEAFLKASKSLPSFREESKFSTWLHRITLNTAKDWLKSQGRKARLKRELAQHLKNLSQSTDEVLCKKIRLAVLELPEKLRTAVELTIFEGYSHKEAAKLLGCAETTVSWRIFQAKKHLKKQLLTG